MLLVWDCVEGNDVQLVNGLNMPLCFYIYVHTLFLLAVIDHLTFALTPVSQKSDGISYSLQFNLANIYWVISLLRYCKTASSMSVTKRKRRIWEHQVNLGKYLISGDQS